MRAAVGELSYSVLSDRASVELRSAAEGAVLHRVWVVCLRGSFFRLSWCSRVPVLGLPECRAYLCDERGETCGEECLARCYCVNPNVAFAEVMDQLLALGAA